MSALFFYAPVSRQQQVVILIGHLISQVRYKSVTRLLCRSYTQKPYYAARNDVYKTRILSKLIHREFRPEYFYAVSL